MGIEEEEDDALEVVCMGGHCKPIGDTTITLHYCRRMVRRGKFVLESMHMVWEWGKRNECGHIWCLPPRNVDIALVEAPTSHT